MNLQDMKNLSPEKQKELFDRLNRIRKKAKTTTYSATYGVGKAKLARTAGTSEAEAQTLLDGFWKLNWAVKAFADDQEVKTVNNQMWVRNPVNKYWYTLRYRKDIFSTINQGTGAYCFDQWLAYAISGGLALCFQAHDELVTCVDEGEEEWLTHLLKQAVGRVNKKLKLNVDLDVDVQYGRTYADVH